jgi:hypothetical protein
VRFLLPRTKGALRKMFRCGTERFLDDQPGATYHLPKPDPRAREDNLVEALVTIHLGPVLPVPGYADWCVLFLTCT